MLRKLHYLKAHFASKKQITVNNIFNQQPLGKYTSLDDTQLDALVSSIAKSHQ